jgi:DNA-binding NtrC family response regulator
VEHVNALRVESIRRKEQQNESFSESNASSTGNVSVPNRILPADVRVIAATNRDLTATIGAGTFRADLFYRLDVFPIEVPPLRKQKEDIPMLVEYFHKTLRGKSWQAHS